MKSRGYIDGVSGADEPYQRLLKDKAQLTLDTNPFPYEFKTPISNKPSIDFSIPASALEHMVIKAANKMVSGSGFYLETKFIPTGIALQAYSNIKSSLANNKEILPSVVCGIAGATAQAATALAGYDAILIGATAIVAGSRGTALLQAGGFAYLGFKAVDKLSNEVGTITQNTCHKAFDLSKQTPHLVHSLFSNTNIQVRQPISSIIPPLKK